MSELYPYDKGDRFISPEYYMYSKYDGHDFLKAFMETRTRSRVRLETLCVERMKDGDVPSHVAPLAGLLSEWVPQLGGGFSDLSAEAVNGDLMSPTAGALLELCQALNADEDDIRLSFYIGRFEVSKRLRTQYPQLDGEDGEPDGPLAHALLMLCCGVHVLSRKSLKSFNALLKLGDLVCSDAFLDAGSDALCAALAALAMEEAAFLRLADKKGVVL